VSIANIKNGILPKTRIKVNNIELEAMFDTGAGISIMSYEVAKKHNFNINKSELKIKGVHEN
jgi:hypothetical protein